jgi:hypothetical protein
VVAGRARVWAAAGSRSKAMYKLLDGAPFALLEFCRRRMLSKRDPGKLKQRLHGGNCGDYALWR